MNNELLNLKPERLWYYFTEILKVPRPSKKEEKIRDYLVAFGKKHNLETVVDQVGNVIIRKPAMPGYENRKPAILQSHMDMVCEKNADTVHDFEKDPITAWIDGEWIKAKGTTLGADDGIGMAAQLAILEADDIPHGPIECLITMDEETGMTGAFGLEPGSLKGRILLNLDSEDEGELFIGCAGGKDTVAMLSYQKENVPSGAAAFKVAVTGLKGGHSGDDINKGLGNANKILNRFLWNAERMFSIRLSHIDGGNLRNAIAREAYAVITVDSSHKENLKKYLEQLHKEIKAEFASTEPGFKMGLEEVQMPQYLIDADTQFKLFNAIYACPHGVIAMTADMPGLVETSTNLASIKTDENNIVITTSQRSSVESAKTDIGDMVASVFLLAGGKVEHSGGYPGWKPDLNSEILEITRSTYKKLFGKDPKVLAIHAGLECGLIGKKFPGMDMVSFGPTLRGVHSPDERLNIETADRFWQYLVETLKNIPVAE